MLFGDTIYTHCPYLCTPISHAHDLTIIQLLSYMYHAKKSSIYVEQFTFFCGLACKQCNLQVSNSAGISTFRRETHKFSSLGGPNIAVAHESNEYRPATGQFSCLLTMQYNIPPMVQKVSLQL